jgi:hypothetical protein
LNLRPPGYEPGELPDCSTPRRERHDSTGLSLVALAFLVGFAAVVASSAFVVVRSIALWRDARAFSRALGGELGRFTDSLERLAAFEPPDTERLTTAVARIEASRERLSILTGALGRVQGQWVGMTAIYPKK